MTFTPNRSRRQFLLAAGSTAFATAFGQSERTFNVFDYLSPWERKEVKSSACRLDVAPAIEEASAAAHAAGGGTVLLPAGGYLLGTISNDPDSSHSYVTARDRVSLRGAGVKRTILKVKAGENARLNGTNGPNIIATQKAHPLCDCTYSDFSVDWDGAHNLLKPSDTPRQNCTILSVNGGINITCARIRSIGTPGNQCILLAAASEMGQRNITLIDCEAVNCGSGLPGNYNIDHSSFYANGRGLLFQGLRGLAERQVKGALFELHGSDARAVNCVSDNYQLGFWIASNFQLIQDIIVSHGLHTRARSAFSISAEAHPANNIEISHCDFVQGDFEPEAGPMYFVNGNTIAACNSMYVHHCRFLGKSYPFMRFLQMYKLASFRLESNLVQNFANFGVVAAGLDIGDGRFISELSVRDNVFTDVELAVYANVPALAAGRVIIENNTFDRTEPDVRPAITVGASSSTGKIGPNRFSKTYITPVENRSNGAVSA